MTAMAKEILDSALWDRFEEAAQKRRRDPVAALWHVPELYNKIDKAMIQQAAKTYLNTNAYVEVMLFPEKK